MLVEMPLAATYISGSPQEEQNGAARYDQGGSRKPIFLRSEQSGDYDVAAGLQLAVGLNDDAAAQVVLNKNLMGFSQT